MPESQTTRGSSASPPTQQKGSTSRGRFGVRPGLKQWLYTALGVIVGLIAVDLSLYPFVASWYWPRGPIRTIRAYGEGIAESHFVPDGFGTYGHRLTGNAPVAGAPTVMILGDSHVVQDSVSDRETVGSVVERLSRSDQRPVNVRQYGWYETAAPTFIAEAPALLKHCQPAKVVVLMNYTDLSSEVFNGQYWQMKPNGDGAFRLIDVRPPKVETPDEFSFRDLAGASRLLVAGRRRAFRILETAKAAPIGSGVAADLSGIAPASVQGLKAAYGDRLLIVFTPICHADCSDKPDDRESALLQACEEQSVRCVSIRKQMLEELATNARLARGFHNTAPGIGHLNAIGLDLCGRVIWREIAASFGR
jgi:hypothetical protein